MKLVENPLATTAASGAEIQHLKDMKRIAYAAFILWTSFVHADIRFTRVTDKTGIQFRHFNGATGEKHLVETMGGGAAFFDYDSDHDLDILVINSADTPDLLRNDTPPVHHWLGVKLVGKKSNRDGIGAKITLRSGDTNLLREIKSGASYLSQNPHRLLIGLGTADRVDKVVVHWQNGVQDVIENVQGNQWLTIREGEGIISD